MISSPGCFHQQADLSCRRLAAYSVSVAGGSTGGIFNLFYGSFRGYENGRRQYIVQGC